MKLELIIELLVVKCFLSFIFNSEQNINYISLKDWKCIFLMRLSI